MTLIKVAQLSKKQRSIVESVPRGIKAVQGPAGTGKTTVGMRRMLRLLTKDKVFANEILVLTPQKTLGICYREAANHTRLDAGGRITVTSLGGLSHQMVDLFYPLIYQDIGFQRGKLTFLTLETTQYHIALAIDQLIQDNRYFRQTSIARPRLYSQIIDNMNKAALVGFPITEIQDRLIMSWGDKEVAQKNMYRDTQACAIAFRQHCLTHNLVDFSLRIEMMRMLWDMTNVRDYFIQRYRHLILDNMEEDVPVIHDMLLDWLPNTESSLVILDTEAGYRRFLGASPTTAEKLLTLARGRNAFTFTESDSFVMSPSMIALTEEMRVSFKQDSGTNASPQTINLQDVLYFETDTDREKNTHYYTDMIDRAAERIAMVVHQETVAPKEIVVLVPFLSDSLRFAMTQALNRQDVPVRSFRPSRALRDEAAIRTMLVWAQIAHPNWRMPVSKDALICALMQTIPDLDLIRAQLAARNLYTPPGSTSLGDFDELDDLNKTRINYRNGNLLHLLHEWLGDYETDPIDELDVFWSRLFDEVLARADFGFHDDIDTSILIANLIDSARKFRQVVQDLELTVPVAQEYVCLVHEGVIADQYLRSWQEVNIDAVLLAPALTFLVMNRPVSYQFWLDVSSKSWWERLYQPLTHPYVLTRDWDWDMEGRVWSDEDEYHTRNDALFKLVLGLMRRCRQEVYLGVSHLGETGKQHVGPMLRAFQYTLRRLNAHDN